MPDRLPKLAPITTLNAHKIRLLGPLSYGRASSLAWSSREKLVAVGTSRGLWLHNAENLREHPVQIQSSIHCVTGVAFHPVENWLFSAEDDGAVHVWNAQAHVEVTTFGLPSGIPIKLKFNRDGSKLFVSGSNNQVYIWDVYNRELLAMLPCKVIPDVDAAQISDALASLQWLCYLVLSPDEHILTGFGYLAHSEIEVWDLRSYSRMRALDVSSSFEFLTGRMRRNLYIDQVAFAGNKYLLAGVGVESYRETQIWNVETGELEDTLAMYPSRDEPISKKNVWIPKLHSTRSDDSARDLGKNRYQIRNAKTGEVLPDLTFDLAAIALNAEKNAGYSFSQSRGGGAVGFADKSKPG